MFDRPLVGNSGRCAITAYWIICILVVCSIWKLLLSENLVVNIRPATRRARRFNADLVEYLDKSAKNQKTILIWYPKNIGTSTREQDKTLSWECGSCLVTSNSSKLEEPSTAAVVILYKYVKPKLMPPEYTRKSHQLYVWLSEESPAGLIVRMLNYSFADSVGFNATMTYRRDSDVYKPYGTNKLPLKNVSNIIKAKQRLAVAIVSNCDDTSGARFRKTYLDFLSSKIDLDTFGRCFDGRIKISRLTTEYLDMISKYKFYFAFENSYHCRDYITEKFYNAFRANSVPVVWGPPRSDYEAVANPKSFIHVDDFETHKDLFRYLTYLDKNDTAYLEYFKHPRTLLPSNDMEDPSFLSRGYCQLCRMVNGINTKRRSNLRRGEQDVYLTETISHRGVVSITKWLKDENADCLRTMAMNDKGKTLTLENRLIDLNVNLAELIKGHKISRYGLLP